MDCKECREWMNEALDSALGDREAAFNDHLNICEECRKEYEEYKMMMQAINDLPDVDVPEGFRDRWQNAVKEEGKGKVTALPLWRRRGFKMVVGIAAAALVAVNVPNMLRMGSEEMSTDEAAFEMAMEEPAAEPEMLYKDMETEESGFGVASEEMTEAPVADAWPEEDLQLEMAMEEPVEPSVTVRQANGLMPSYFFEEADMAEAYTFFAEQEVDVVEVDEETEHTVYLVQLDADTLDLWEAFLKTMEKEMDADGDDMIAGETRQLVEIRVEIVE